MRCTKATVRRFFHTPHRCQRAPCPLRFAEAIAATTAGTSLDLLQKSKTHPPGSPLVKGGSKKNYAPSPRLRGGLGRGFSIFARGLLFNLGLTHQDHRNRVFYGLFAL